MKHLKLFNKRYGIIGDMSYGANGLLYQLVEGSIRLEWIQIDTIDEFQYQNQLKKFLDKYKFDKLVSKLFLKRSKVRNFGKKTTDIEKGFASYLLFRVLHYYGISLDKICVRVKSLPKKNLSGYKFYHN